MTTGLGFTANDRKAVEAFIGDAVERPHRSPIELVAERARADLTELCRELRRPIWWDAKLELEWPRSA